MKQFAPGRGMTALVVMVLPIFLSLGYWQLSRAAEKRSMEVDYLAQLTALPVRPENGALSQRFKRIRLQGRFTDQAFLVDNQIASGRVGYWLIQAFDEVGGRRLLLNRGFVEAPASRADLPEVNKPQGQLRLIGAVWPFTGLVPVLDDDAWPQGWPKRVQRLDVIRMAALVEAESVEIRLEPGQPGVERAAPFAQLLNDARHRGYAATWFALGFTLVVLYLIYGFKNRPTKPDPQR